MLTWLIYDISKNKSRNRVIKNCENAGLVRVQKSVFLGNIEKNTMDELLLQCSEELELEKDSLYIFPMCEEDFKKVKTAGNAFDRELVSDEILSRFF